MSIFRWVRNWWLTLGVQHINLHVGKGKPEKGWVSVSTPVAATKYLERYEVTKLFLEYDLGEDQGTGLGLCHWLDQHPQHTPLVVRLRGTQEQISKMSLIVQSAKAKRYSSEYRHVYHKFLF